jgi:hypothetical protein
MDSEEYSLVRSKSKTVRGSKSKSESKGPQDGGTEDILQKEGVDLNNIVSHGSCRCTGGGSAPRNHTR